MKGGQMIKIKEMPYSEKYDKVMDNMKFDESFIFPFLQKHLGDQAIGEVKVVWQEGFKNIPEEANVDEKYEIAYGNWIWLAKSIYSFIRKRMGEEGIKKFEQAEVEALIKKNNSPALLFVKIIRLISPGIAFSMTCKQMGYQFQWLTPFSVTELTRHRGVFDIPQCKILDFSDTDDLCFIGCQSTYPMWVAKQFKVSMKWNRREKSCTCTLTPLN